VQASSAGAPSGPLRVRALGQATVELAGTALTAADWGYAKPRELLFLLITSPPRTREQLGVALWPDLSRKQLGNALHTALRELRRALGDHDWIIYAASHYSVNRDRALDCDVDTFESSLAAAGRARPASAGLPDLRRAVAAYGGDFLAGMAAGEWASVPCWARLGETARAVRHYAELTALLKDRVGVPPAAETTALYERLAGRG
jgi:DNA-binding SARP family transcriptional activator